MKKTNRTIPTKRSFSTAIIILISVAIALFLLKNSIFDNKKDIRDESDTSKTTINEPLPPHPTEPATPVAASSPSSPNTTTAPPPAPSLDIAPSSTDKPCQKIATDLKHFFDHLESQEYIKAYALNEPIQTYLNRIATKILNTPPVNVKETDDLLTVLKNASHFFRILGIKDLSLIRDILTNEHASLEQQFALLYAWSSQGKECRDHETIKFKFPLAKTYEYAAFFLNTLGGQSYLSRRDSTARVLTKYYCVLIVNQANRQSINTYDINLPYHLEALIKEISNSDFLENQSLYLDTLQAIKADLGRPPKKTTQ